MMEPMDMIKQTGKTIIFEEFNKEKDDLCTLLTRDTDEISTEKFVQSLKSLEVTSYQHFLDKFAPTIYETVVQTEDNTYKFVYELEKPKGDYTEISLKDHAFYKMIVNIFSQKSSSGTSNLEFNYDNLKKALTPMAEMEECKRIRKNLLSNVSEYMKLAASGEPSEEANRFAKNISSCRDEIIMKYQNKSPLGLLPLAIADKQSQIDTFTMVCKEGSSNSSSASYAAIPCKASFDDSGNIIMIAASLSKMEEEEDTLDHNSRIKEVIQDDFQQFAPPTIQNSYMSNLIVNVFAAGGSSSITDIVQLEKVKKQYQDIYKDSLESFVNAVSAIVEKFVGVKAFFDHAAYEGELAKDVSVIISNCRADTIVQTPLAKERFLKYFKNLSEEKDINKIWFGILPAVNEGMIVNQSSEKIDPFAPRNKNAQTNSTGKIGNLISLNAVKEMIDLMQKVKIMTFFNFKAREETSFTALTAKKIQEDRNKLESVDSDYAVFSYPNFTILPKDRNVVKIGEEWNEENQQNKNVSIKIPGIYLEASYIAAGMMVGCQNYKYLASLGFKINPKYPCVRFDLEEGNNAKIVLTRLNRETSTEMSRDVKEEINSDKFGFSFADNKIVFNNKALINSYVFTARTLKKDNEGKYYKSIYKTLVKSLADQLLRLSSDNVTERSVKEFITTYVAKWKRDNKNDEKLFDNSILKVGEDIFLDPTKHKLVVAFNQDTEVWDDIEINDIDIQGEV